jgi:nucleoside-diphosphate-sugar epimerase
MEGRTIPQGALIAVTGASGFIASYVIELLLQKGYRVRAIVRDLKREEKWKHLKDLRQEQNQMEFAEAQIESGNYSQILNGCDAVIHTATPYIYTAADPQVLIIIFLIIRRKRLWIQP